MEGIKKKILIKLYGNYINGLSYVNPKLAAEKALDLFSMPRKGKLSAEDKSYLSQYKSTSHEYKYGAIRSYLHEGDGPSVMLCHGWESNSARWKWLITYLIEAIPNIKIIMLDAPAHGATEGIFFDGDRYARAIKKVADHYRPEIIVGHSVGAFATSLYLYEYASDLPEKVGLLAPPDRIDEVTRNYFEMLSYNDRVQERFQEVVLTRFPKPLDYYTTSDFMGQVAVEGVLIHDHEDDIHPLKDAFSIDKYWKGGQLMETKGYGHSLQAEEVYERIRKLVSGV